MGYVGLALFAGVLSGMWQFGIGLYRGRLSRNAILLISAAIAGVGYVVLGLLTSTLIFDLEDVPEGVIGGILNVAGTLCLLKAYECGKIGVASGVAATSALVPLAYSLYLGEPLTGLTAGGTLLILAGLGMFYGAHLRDGGGIEGGSSGATIFFALGTAFFWGVAIIILDIGTLVSVTGAMAVSEVPQVIIVAVIILIAGARSTFVGATPSAVSVLVGAGVALALSNVMFYVAANMGDIGVASVLGSLSAVVPAILALVFFRERLVRLEQGALVVVLVGTALVLI